MLARNLRKARAAEPELESNSFASLAIPAPFGRRPLAYYFRYCTLLHFCNKKAETPALKVQVGTKTLLLC
jgi:hypothetical protein